MTKADPIPGTLTTAELAILGSTMPWTKHESDTGAIAWVSGPYRILSEGDNPRYWTATVRLDRDRVQLASGAGDLGLAKCVRYAEKHWAACDSVSSQETRSAKQATQTSTASDVVRNRAVWGPETSSNNLTSPQQQQLL